MGFGEGWEWWVAGAFSITSIAVSSGLMFGHLRRFTNPIHQKYIIRIILMVPLYALMAWFALGWQDQSLYFNTIKDCYEAFVIYSFLQLLFAYLGGPSKVVQHYETLEKDIDHPPPCCFLPAVRLNARFLRTVKQGTLQFVILKPIMAFIILTLDYNGVYREGDYSPSYGYLYIQIVYNISYSLALYALMLFYKSAEEPLRPFSPVRKFLLIKMVVFLTFWQGFLVSILAASGAIHDGVQVQNFALCVEMCVAAVCMCLAFPPAEYSTDGPVSAEESSAGRNMGKVLNMKDVVLDVKHNFTRQYQDYVIQDQDGETKVVYTANTFVLTDYLPGGKDKSKKNQSRSALLQEEGGVRSDDLDLEAGQGSADVENPEHDTHQQQARRSSAVGDVAVHVNHAGLDLGAGVARQTSFRGAPRRDFGSSGSTSDDDDDGRAAVSASGGSGSGSGDAHAYSSIFL